MLKLKLGRERLRKMLREGAQKEDIAREFGVSVMSLWRFLR
ncbi:MAG: helix-turn-helix domain-containing protein [Fibromonadaceae bacterium]|jgi:uncharacterized protein YerC|nr:helix-turn-helix domain-containing protein [Fibromonadaceae bacterium]